MLATNPNECHALLRKAIAGKELHNHHKHSAILTIELTLQAQPATSSHLNSQGIFANPKRSRDDDAVAESSTTNDEANKKQKIAAEPENSINIFKDISGSNAPAIIPIDDDVVMMDMQINSATAHLYQAGILASMATVKVEPESDEENNDIEDFRFGM